MGPSLMNTGPSRSRASASFWCWLLRFSGGLMTRPGAWSPRWLAPKCSLCGRSSGAEWSWCGTAVSGVSCPRRCRLPSLTASSHSICRMGLVLRRGVANAMGVVLSTQRSWNWTTKRRRFPVCLLAECFFCLCIPCSYGACGFAVSWFSDLIAVGSKNTY